MKYFRDLQFVYNPYIFRIKTDNLAPKKLPNLTILLKYLTFVEKCGMICKYEKCTFLCGGFQ